MATYEIFTGFWTDWNYGKFLGATITLSPRDSAVLLALIATFTTLFATRLWRILSYVAHQISATGGRHDGLYYQRQFILRNTTSPTSATLLFLRQAWHWRRIVRFSLFRTMPWVVSGIIYVSLSALLAIFSSRLIESASPSRLIKAAWCGIVDNSDITNGFGAMSDDATRASSYARQCYVDFPPSSCNTMAIPRLQWTNSTVECPFSEACTDVPGFRMETERIDSHIHFGINAPEHERIQYIRRTTCSPLDTSSTFVQNITSDEASVLGVPEAGLTKYMYGDFDSQPYTYLHREIKRYGAATYGIGYTFNVFGWFNDGDDYAWTPIKGLAVNNSDVTLLLIAFNGMVHVWPNEDPVFGASRPTIERDVKVYPADRPMSAMACVDEHQICNNNNGVCSPFNSSYSAFASSNLQIGLSDIQLATLQHLQYSFTVSGTTNLLLARQQGFPRAKESVLLGAIQMALPPNQWQLEMMWLFMDGLSLLQQTALKYVAGPDTSLPFNWTRLEVVDAEADKRLCDNQRVMTTHGTSNFSVFWLSILLLIESGVIFLSFVLDIAVGFVQTKTGIGAVKAKRWMRDDELQAMKMLFQLRKAGAWEEKPDSFPVTETGDEFEYDQEYLGYAIIPNDAVFVEEEMKRSGSRGGNFRHHGASPTD